MVNIACCEVELNRMNNGMRRVLKDTMRVFREASEIVGNIVEERWDDVKRQDTSKDKLTYVERFTLPDWWLLFRRICVFVKLLV